MTKIKAYAKLNKRKVIKKHDMDNYFIGREMLTGIIDNLIAKKTQPIENLDTLREESIKKLDDQIGRAIFSSLTKKQLDEFNVMLDQDGTDDQAFRDFFKRAGIDLEKTIMRAVQDFSEEFLGGENV